MKKINILLLGTVALFLGSCCEEDFNFDNNHHIRGHGIIKTKNISVGDFSKIELENVANVYITTDESVSVEITAYENILNYLEAKVTDGELELKTRDHYEVSSDKEIRVDITMPEINKVTLNGVGDFFINGPEQEILNIDLNGVGNVNAFELPVYQGDVDINGTGNVKMQAKESLNVDINGIGNVHYQGDPELSVNINGFGNVVKY